MRRSFLVAFSMTLFMLLLVLLAAFYFSYQSQRQLQQRLTDARQDGPLTAEMATRQADELNQVQATRQTAVDALATAEAEAVLLEGQLVNSQQQAEGLRHQIDTLTDSLATLEEAGATRDVALTVLTPPLVAVVQPDDNAVVTVGQTIQIIVAASDRGGLTELQIEIGDETSEVTIAAGNSIYVHIEEWTPTTAGSITILARADNINGQTMSALPRTIQVVDAAGTDE